MAIKTPEDYRSKRSFDSTPEPPPKVDGDVDPSTAIPGSSFVIHQHHATRMHFDLRLEMLNGDEPVLVSWAVPKNLPRDRSSNSLAIKVEDHPFEYGSFSGTIPKGNYGAGEVRVFDHGRLEVIKQEDGKMTFRLKGRRLNGIYTLIRWKNERGKQQWLARLKEDLRPPPDKWPPARPMRASEGSGTFDDDGWLFQPCFDGTRTLVRCDGVTEVIPSERIPAQAAKAVSLQKVHERIVAVDALIDGVVVRYSNKDCFVAFDLLYLDGKDLTGQALAERSALLSEAVVSDDSIQVAPSVVGRGQAMADAAAEMGIGGIVAKKLDSPYETGAVTTDWLKIG